MEIILERNKNRKQQHKKKEEENNIEANYGYGCVMKTRIVKKRDRNQ